MPQTSSSPNRNSYMYRPTEVQSKQLSLFRRVIRWIEKCNKFLTLRIIGLCLRVHKLHTPLPLESISSVLFIRYDALGDMVVTTPLWRILKRIKPSIKIGVAGSSKNIGLLTADNDVDRVYDYSATSFREIVAKTKEARVENWDLVVLCKFNQKTRGGIVSRLSTQNGYNITIGTNNIDGHQALFSRLVTLPITEKPLQMTSQLQHLLRSCIMLPDVPLEHPSIIVDSATETRMKNIVDTVMTHDYTNKYVMVNVDAPEVRKWGLENNIQLIKYIENTYTDISIIIVALPDNHERVVTSIKSAQLQRTHYIPTHHILELVAIVRYAHLIITPDTGIVHIASAEKKPLLGLYPEAGEWLPYETNYIVLLPESGKSIRDIPVHSAVTYVDKLISTLDSNINVHIRDIVSL